MNKSASLISIIVPVYKVEPYLDQCVKSIIDQTYKNLEIILIDDGSPDNCPIMCDEWAKRDSRIKVLHVKNGGASSARNAGLDIAQGEYIGFVDSDDYIAPDMYEILLNALISSDKKISCCYSVVVFDSTISNIQRTRSYNPVILDTVQTMDSIFDFRIGTSFWHRLYHKSVFDRIRLPVGEINEEYPLLIPTTVLAGGTVLVEQNLYCYRQRNESVSKTAHLSYSTCKCVLKNLNLMAQQLKEYQLPCQKSFSVFAVRNAYYMLISMEKNKAEWTSEFIVLHKQYLKIARKNWLSFLLSKQISGKDKILFLLILTKLFVPIYQLLKKSK